MFQALHILQKDLRFLWRELALLFVLFILFGWKEYIWTEPLLELTAIYVIARLFHAEPIPGDTQFWITRPYSWKSLLAAKLVFVAAFINVPLMISRIVLLHRQGFPIVSNITPLLWSQCLIFLSVLPVAALASVTADTLPFILSMLMLAVVGFGAEAATIPFENRLAPYLMLPPTSAEAWPLGVRWVRGSVIFGVLCAASLLTLWGQYKFRRTRTSRVAAMIILACAIVVFWVMPVSFAMAVHTRLSRSTFDTSTIRVAVGDKPQKFAVPRRDEIQISLPLTVLGIPADVEAEADGLAVTLESADGKTLRSFTSPGRRAVDSEARGFDAIFFVDPLFFNSARQLGTKLHATLYLTMFGNAKSQSAVLSTTPTNVGSGLQCFVNPITSQMECRSPFRWPSALVYAKVLDRTESVWPMISYSPFPAGVELNAVEEHSAGGPPPHDPKVTIVVKETLAHEQRDFEVQDFRIGDFARLR
jgi:hypothetical protein